MKKGLIYIILLMCFLCSNIPTYAQITTITREIPSTTEISLPGDLNSENPCPEIITGNISVCGQITTAVTTTKTITAATTSSSNVENTHDPIEGVTVAVYLGAEHANLPDKNKTGEYTGKLEGLYSYDITNNAGRFIVPIPRNRGTNNFAFIGFFCGDILKDLYMVDTSKTIKFMPISLSCNTSVSPSTQNNIPAPPAIKYIDRLQALNCEGDVGDSSNAMEVAVTKSVNIDLERKGFEDTYLDPQASINEVWENGTLVSANEDGIANPIPTNDTVLSRKDLEGFTHSSMAYSMQAISSLNCGTGGCYSTDAPTTSSEKIEAVDCEIIKDCNASFPVPQNCLGPAVGMQAPYAWQEALNLENDQMVVCKGKGFLGLPDEVKLKDIDEPSKNWVYQMIAENIIDNTINLFSLDWTKISFTLANKSSLFFPYSMMLNKSPKEKTVLHNIFQNRPSNDSYRNAEAADICGSEWGRQKTSLSESNWADYPFKACYDVVLTYEDTYSTQKALYTSTKNIDREEPPVAMFYAPYEKVGEETDPEEGYFDNGVTNTEKVGGGYWRLGVMNTLCTHGVKDTKPFLPVLAISGSMTDEK